MSFSQTSANGSGLVRQLRLACLLSDGNDPRCHFRADLSLMALMPPLPAVSSLPLASASVELPVGLPHRPVKVVVVTGKSNCRLFIKFLGT